MAPFGKRGEIDLKLLLEKNGHSVFHVRTFTGFDLWVDNEYRIEAKVGSLNASGRWFFNIHRHNKLKEDSVDLYILGFHNKQDAVFYAAVEAPVGKKSMSVSQRAVSSDWAHHLSLFDAFLKGDYKPNQRHVAFVSNGDAAKMNESLLFDRPVGLPQIDEPPLMQVRLNDEVRELIRQSAKQNKRSMKFEVNSRLRRTFGITDGTIAKGFPLAETEDGGSFLCRPRLF